MRTKQPDREALRGDRSVHRTTGRRAGRLVIVLLTDGPNAISRRIRPLPSPLGLIHVNVVSDGNERTSHFRPNCERIGGQATNLDKCPLTN